jgi:hypothetical protein
MLVRSRLNKMAPNICIGGHGCGPSSDWLKRERVVWPVAVIVG